MGFDITKDMKNIKNIGYLCLTVVLFLEAGSVIVNLDVMKETENYENCLCRHG